MRRPGSDPSRIHTFLSPSSRNIRRGFLAVAVVALAAGALNGAWQRTRLRECYLPELEARARRSPADAPLLALLGARLMEASELDAAADALRRAAAAGDNTDEVWLSLAATNAARGQRGAALGDLALAQQTHGDAPALRAAQARVQALPPGAAGAALTQALCPQGPQAILGTHAAGSFLNGAQEWWGRHHPESSGYATRQDWVAQQPEDAQALRLWGLALERNRRLPEAGAALERAVAQAPRSPQAHLALAHYLGQTEVLGRAISEYLVCLKLRPDWLPALLGLGDVAWLHHQNKLASDTYQAATRVAPRSIDSWVGLGRADLTLRYYLPKSLQAFGTAAQLAPERTDFYPSYGDALRRAGRWDEAETLLRRRRAAAPEDADCHFFLSLVLMDSRPSPTRNAEAESELRTCLRLTPGLVAPNIFLAQLLMQRGATEEAAGHLEEALKADPYNVNALRRLAQIYRQLKRQELSDEVMARAASVSRDQESILSLQPIERAKPLSVQVHSQLASLFARIGRPDLARNERQTAGLLQTRPKETAADLARIRQSLPGDLAR